MADRDPQCLFEYVTARLSACGIAHLSVLDGGMTGQHQQPFDYLALRRELKGCCMAYLMYNFESATAAVREGRITRRVRAVLHRHPDLIKRLRVRAPLTEPDARTFYGGDARGYVDYPTLDESVTAKIRPPQRHPGVVPDQDRRTVEP